MFNFLRHANSTSKRFCCTKCSAETTYVIAKGGCRSCGNHLFRVADRGTGAPNAFTDSYDPYNPPRKQRGQMTPGDEKQTGLGTNDRGNAVGGLGVSGYSAVEDRMEDQKRDIPYADHKFMGGDSPDGGGFTNGEYADPQDSLSRTNLTFNELQNKQREPIGPSNMQKYRDVWDKVKQRQKGF